MIYAVNKRTKEHRRFYGIAPMAMDTYADTEFEVLLADDDGWISWEGGECPLPNNQEFEIRYKDGKEKKLSRPQSHNWQSKADRTGDRSWVAYRPILEETAKPEAPEWDGKGSPPVRMRCEYWTDAAWEECEIIARKSGKVVFWHPRHEQAYQGPEEEYDFRPIRSEEDRAVEEIRRIACGVGIDDGWDFARALYRAGYRKTATADGEDA